MKVNAKLIVGAYCEFYGISGKQALDESWPVFLSNLDYRNKVKKEEWQQQKK